MIICSCAVISCEDIRRAVDWMRAADPQVVITPGKVYRTLGKKPVCGGCASLFVAKAHEHPISDVPAELRNLRTQDTGAEGHEGRRESHRVPKSRIA